MSFPSTSAALQTCFHCSHCWCWLHCLYASAMLRVSFLWSVINCALYCMSAAALHRMCVTCQVSQVQVSGTVIPSCCCCCCCLLVVVGPKSSDKWQHSNKGCIAYLHMNVKVLKAKTLQRRVLFVAGLSLALRGQRCRMPMMLLPCPWWLGAASLR